MGLNRYLAASVGKGIAAIVLFAAMLGAYGALTVLGFYWLFNESSVLGAISLSIVAIWTWLATRRIGTEDIGA